jgi:hypothetical protein
VSKAKIKQDIAHLMIDECDYVLETINFDAKTTGQLHLDVWRTRKAFWEKVEDDAFREHATEGVE